MIEAYVNDSEVDIVLYYSEVDTILQGMDYVLINKDTNNKNILMIRLCRLRDVDGRIGVSVDGGSLLYS